MASMHESIALLHKARNLLQRLQHPGHEPAKLEILEYLADSESFIADGCGHKVHYFKPD